MLTKRQLEDAAKCKSNEACMTCRVLIDGKIFPYEGCNMWKKKGRRG